jgi:LmbE family N-acetylglucosaminyl deacetylase
MVTAAARIGAALDITTVQAPVLVVAPHPDDESIGCGGLIAALRQRQLDVQVVILTDGTGSHANSARYPASRLADLRKGEALEALAILGVAPDAVAFWQLADRFVPDRDSATFESTVVRAHMRLRLLSPATLVIPGRTDSHGDHRAAWSIWTAAADRLAVQPRILEYLVWPGVETAKGVPRQLDIASVLSLKRQAIAAHRSQHGLVIDDDPDGFSLPDDLLARAALPWEGFFEDAS